MNRKLGFRTSGLRHIGIDDALAGIAVAGFDAVEFCMEHPEASCDKLLLARRLGLDVSAVSYHGKKDDPEKRAEMCEKAVRMAYECSVMTVVFGSPLEGEERFMNDSERIHSLCMKYGIKPAWETEPGTILDSLDDFYRLIAPLGPCAGINLDAGHLHLHGNCTIADIEQLGQRIHHVHIEGMQRNNHLHLMPGAGDMNWKELLRGLELADYRGVLVIDLFTIPDNWREYLSCAKAAACEVIDCSDQ